TFHYCILVCISCCRLSENTNWTVLLIEAEGKEPAWDSVSAYETYTQHSRLTVYWPVEEDKRFCGGKMCKFFGDNDGWGYEEILPFFKKWENNLDPEFYNDTKYHAKGGSQSVGRWQYTDTNVKALLSAFEEVGLQQSDINGPVQEGTKRATGVEFASQHTGAKLGKLKAKKEIILSGGAISSPQILMLSGIGPEKTFKSLGIPVIESLNVGENLQTHYRIDVKLLKSVRGKMPEIEDDVLSDFIQYNSNHSGPLSATGPFVINGYIHSSLSKPTDIPDIQLLFGPRYFYKTEPPPLFQMPISYYDSITGEAYLVLPKSRGYVTINSTNPFSSPVIKAFHKIEEQDFLRLADGIYFLTEKLYKTESFQQLGEILDEKQAPLCSQHTFNTREYWLCYAKHYSEPQRHYAGTCKMGPPSDPTAVVDSKLKVHGILNLRVIDASIMPLLVNGNVNAPVLMIAEKGADMIIKEHRNF
ncbi:Glucose dehydrogenase [FAD, quinone], partial [Blattella germanica]